MNNKSNTSIYRRVTIVGVLCIALLGSVLNAAPEKVIVITDGDVAPVTALLEDGWTVKHQSASASGAGDRRWREFRSTIVFTLTPPSDEVLAAANAKREEARKAAWAKKKAEYEASKRVEK